MLLPISGYNISLLCVMERVKSAVAARCLGKVFVNGEFQFMDFNTYRNVRTSIKKLKRRGKQRSKIIYLPSTEISREREGDRLSRQTPSISIRDIY